MSNITQYVSIASLPPWANETGADLQNSKIALEVAHPGAEDNTLVYSSRSITLPALASALYYASLSTIIYDYYKIKPGDYDLSALSTLNNLFQKITVPTNPDDKTITFASTPIVNNAGFVITENKLKDNLSSNSYKNYVSISNNGTEFHTVYHNLENRNTTLTVDSISQAPAIDSDKHNRYIFKVYQHTSDEYICTKSGWFTCYGWLSEKETYAPDSASGKGVGRQDNSKRWAVLEGKFGNDWKILQFQPLTPGNLCNYVSFSLPVKQNLVLRISTGFDVGNNSGKWSSVPGSLTNHIPNAFIGGIYV